MPQPWNATAFFRSCEGLVSGRIGGALADGANVALFDFDESIHFRRSRQADACGSLHLQSADRQRRGGLGHLSVGWDPWHEMRPVIRARVIAADYSEHDLDPSAITEEPARGGDYKTYSDGKRLTRSACLRLRPAWWWRRSTSSARLSRSLRRDAWAAPSSDMSRYRWRTAAQSSRRPRRCRCALKRACCRE